MGIVYGEKDPAELTETPVIVQPEELVQVMSTSGWDDEWCALYRATQAINLSEDAA